MRQLGGPAGLSFALAINAFGTIAGSTPVPSTGGSDPAIWRGAAPLPLGLPSPFVYGFVYGLSFTGIATGSLETDTSAEGFVWQGGSLESIGRLGDYTFTRALSVDSAGEIVGAAFEAQGGSTRAVLWRAGTTSDLNTVLPAASPWTLWTANDVNDLGQIVGYGLDGDVVRAYELTPPLRQQVSNLIAFARALETGSTPFEARAVRALNGVLRGRRGCAALAALPRAATREKKLGAVRRQALRVRISGLARNAGCP
jgi:hypothetical protein